MFSLPGWVSVVLEWLESGVYHSHILANLFFRWLNLILFFGLLAYAYWRFWARDLAVRLRKEQHRVYEQEKIVGQINEALQAEQQQITEQEAQYALLLQKIKQWQQSTLQRQAEQAAAQAMTLQALMIKRQVQADNLAVLHVQHQLFTQILAASRHDLQKIFTQPTTVANYQKTLLKKIQVGEHVAHGD